MNTAEFKVQRSQMPGPRHLLDDSVMEPMHHLEAKLKALLFLIGDINR